MILFSLEKQTSSGKVWGSVTSVLASPALGLVLSTEFLGSLNRW